MKLIKDVSRYKNQYEDQIIIEFTNGYLRIGNKPDNKDYKGLNLCLEENKYDKNNFKQYDSLSMEELVSFQNIILSAYFFQSDLLDETKEKKNSIESIKKELELLAQIRVHLRSISAFIASYEDLVVELIPV
jgi:hypothetical protein